MKGARRKGSNGDTTPRTRFEVTTEIRRTIKNRRPTI